MEKTIFLKYNGKFIGCNPQPQKTKLVKMNSVYRGTVAREVPLTGDDQFPVYSDRDHASGWEAVKLTKHESGQFSGQFVDSGRQLTINPVNGLLETRAGGTIEAWQLFNAAQQPDGTIHLWLAGDPAPSIILLVQEAN